MIYLPIVDNLGNEIQKNHLLFHSGNNHQKFAAEENPTPEQVEDTVQVDPRRILHYSWTKYFPITLSDGSEYSFPQGYQIEDEGL